MLFWCAPVRADVVGAKGEAIVIGVKIASLEKGSLAWTTADGSRVERPIERIDYLQITGWPLFNVAEKQFREHYVHQACLTFEKALSDLGEERPAASPAVLDRHLLIRARLIRAYEADRQPARAAEVFVKMLIRPGGLAWQTLQPGQMAQASEVERAAAARMVDAAIEQHPGDEIERILKTWRKSWGAASQPASAEAPSESTEPSAAIFRNEATDRIAQLLRDKHADEAQSAARTLQKESSGLLKAEAFFLEAQAHLAQAVAQPARAATERKRAGFLLMRVIVHYPDSPRAAMSLYQAGRICRESGEIEQARGLWSELIAHYAGELTLVAAARKNLEEIQNVTSTRPAETRSR